MDTELAPNRDGDVREKAMGGKHQRSLSLSARWASDKAMAVEYLRRQRDVMSWIESVLKRELPTTDLYEALKSGVVLREMMEILFPDASNCMSPISRKYTKRMAPWKERENISVFLRQCKSIGMYDLSLFCTDDLYEGTNMVQVLFCVQHFMMFSEEQVGHLFKPVAKNEPTEFSNQELEMAMSKIEQAGVDAKALKGLISGSSSSTPEKDAVQEKESTVRAASKSISVPRKEERLERTKEEEPAGIEECSDDNINVEVQSEVCNQMSEDKQDNDNPADDDGLNPEQECGSNADNAEEVTQPEHVSVTEEKISVSTDDYPPEQDEEVMEIIKHALSDMAAAIEEEVNTKLAAKEDVPTVEAAFKTPRVEIIDSPEVEAEAVTAEPMDSSAEASSIPAEEEEVAADPTEDEATEAKADDIDQTNFEIEIPATDSTGAPTESTPAEEASSAQPAAEITAQVTERSATAVSLLWWSYRGIKPSVRVSDIVLYCRHTKHKTKKSLKPMRCQSVHVASALSCRLEPHS
ncbi:hypothetical protein PHMEG_0007562 [Phytophthora megakarya]|uniref:Calponin-homology (CH) domain-containing protein n=1 Tax=Phytophthora megakarya TaxID=4795 RepID=A0A225WKY8_9STRA|nr:hypothetical protein PHMEG_0007562 [Phytophthora megakarya]